MRSVSSAIRAARRAYTATETTKATCNAGPSTPSLRRQRRHAESQQAQDESKVESNTQDELEAEAQVRANPWEFMANQRVRQCIVTRNRLPSVFLIALRPAILPRDPSKLYLLPDGVLHPRYAQPKTGKGYWVTCRRDVLEALHSPGPHTAALRQLPGVEVPKHLADLIQKQLLLRVLQELEMLNTRVKSINGQIRLDRSRDLLSKSAEMEAVGPILRTLHKGEQHDEQAVAYLDMGRLEQARLGKAAAHPVPSSFPSDLPFYQLSSLFPGDLHERLRKLLNALLASERPALWRVGYERHPSKTTRKRVSSVLALRTWPGGEWEKGLLGVPLAVALWRLRCWSGEGWAEVTEMEG